MPGRRSQVALSPAEQADILDEARTLEVATIGRDGFPHLVAMWYSVIDGALLFSTYGKSQKVLNLRRDPKVTAMVELGRAYDELRGLVLKGTATIIEAGTSERELLEPSFQRAMAARYGGDAEARLSPKRVIVRIRPLETYSWDHRKLAAGVH